ncbi:MAG TPA: hypothetical protein VKG66_04550 [Steroidobacteraceae bacterium]|nr:hypothetical protein [Steroidobacteraceae bacterium]
MSDRLLAAFCGPVACRFEPKPPRLMLSGYERGPQTPLKVLINGIAQPLPALQLADAELYESADATTGGWMLRSGAQRYGLAAASVQVHRDATLALASALPPQPLAWTTRAGWRLLLLTLRLPGMVRLLQWLRS